MSAYRLSLDGRPTPAYAQTPQSTWRRFLLKHITTLSLFLMVTLLVAIVLVPYMVINIPTGHVGVLWLRFRGGTVLDPRQLKNEGLRIVAPWNEVVMYDLRLQSRTDTYTAISKDGVDVVMGINIRFRLKHDAIPQLHQSVGPDFVTTLVVPEIGNRMREVIADYTAEEVYSTKRQEIQDKIRGRSEAMLGEKMIEQQETEDSASYRIPLYAMLNLVDTLILDIELPPAIVTAINHKLEQYYISEEYTFRVERERKESQRKKIEAEGIREFQQLVSQGISDSYLRWRGIEATLGLAQSTNSKIVIMGGGKGGMPIILNVDTPPPLPEKPPTASSSAAPSEKTPAAGLAGPSEKEKSPAAGLAGPSEKEKTPAAGLAGPSEKEKTPAAPEVPHTYFPFPVSMSDIEAFFSWLAGTTRTAGSTTAPVPK
jgi:regulator of protease activity HflC (stomatin/prohibitin superfamily)